MIQIASNVDTEIDKLEARVADLKALREAEARVRELREKLWPAPVTTLTLSPWASGGSAFDWTKTVPYSDPNKTHCYSVK